MLYMKIIFYMLVKRKQSDNLIIFWSTCVCTPAPQCNVLLTIYLYNEKQQKDKIVVMIAYYGIFTEWSQTSKKCLLTVTEQPCCQSVSPSFVWHADTVSCISKQKSLRQQLLLLLRHLHPRSVFNSLLIFAVCIQTRACTHTHTGICCK